MQLTGLTSSGAVVAVLAVLAWAAARFIGGRPLYIVSYTLVVLLVASFVIGRRPLPITGERSESRPRLRAGEVVTMSVQLTSTRRASTFVLEERVPPALGDTDPLPVAVLEAGETVEHAYQLTCRRRGVYEIGPLIVRSGDPFGLTKRERILVEPVEVLVHPSTEDVVDRPLTRMFEDPAVPTAGVTALAERVRVLRHAALRGRATTSVASSGARSPARESCSCARRSKASLTR